MQQKHQSWRQLGYKIKRRNLWRKIKFKANLNLEPVIKIRNSPSLINLLNLIHFPSHFSKGSHVEDTSFENYSRELTLEFFLLRNRDRKKGLTRDFYSLFIRKNFSHIRGKLNHIIIKRVCDQVKRHMANKLGTFLVKNSQLRFLWGHLLVKWLSNCHGKIIMSFSKI